jgi:exodeoxyribonuclease V alpha subunit
MDRSAGKPQTLKGRLEAVFFEKNGFVIGMLAGGDKIKGPMENPQVGLEYTLSGRWQSDRKWGLQFVFTEYAVRLPTQTAAIREYLIESAKWIGPVIADRIVDAYGAQTLTICKDDPDRVAKEIRGISPKRAAEIAGRLRANETQEELLLALKKLFRDVPIPRRAVAKIIERWGAEAPTRVAADPYALIGVIEGVGFLLADKIARRAGYAAEGPARIQAGLIHVLTEAAYGTGHTCLPKDRLVDDSARLLDLGAGAIRAATIQEQIALLVDREALVVDGGFVYLAGLHRDEIAVARKVRTLAAQKPVPGHADHEGLAADQREALNKAIRAGVFILTGAPGTGKTYTIRRILTSFRRARIALAAPTGKAAKRMAELTGEPAQTIHRLLEPRPLADGGYVFDRNRQNPIEADILVIDETSMVDISLMAKLLDAVDPATRVILVGDTYQLPPVGPGNVLKDLIASNVIASTELTQIKRQDEGLIVRNCHHIKAGEDIELPRRGDRSEALGADFFFLQREDPEAIRDAVLELVNERLPRAYGVDPRRDIQVITPLRERGELSCQALNARFQERFHGRGRDFRSRGISAAERADDRGPGFEAPFEAGDKVIQTRNRYDLDILNGDIGFVRELRSHGRILVVDFDNPPRRIEIPAKENELELAYAITCHKFQGSEAPIVVIPLHRSAGRFLLVRSWLYTAVSRARRMCVLVGQRAVVPEIVARNPQHRRYSRLANRLNRS